jgi:hypothetical protein
MSCDASNSNLHGIRQYNDVLLTLVEITNDAHDLSIARPRANDA